MAKMFKCQLCDNIPEVRQVFQCSNMHLMCVPCGLKNERVCKYDKKSLLVATNPWFKQMENLPLTETMIESLDEQGAVAGAAKSASYQNCAFVSKGCNWTFGSTTDVEAHLRECKYRPYTCIGTQLGIWNCDWKGTLTELDDHLKVAHLNMQSPYNYYHCETMSFVSNESSETINLIDAFSKRFLFFYNSKADSPNVIFMIALLGRRSDAQKYLIDFELRQGVRKMKFVEQCFSDTDGLNRLIDEHRCISIPKNIVESFSHNGNIDFRFVIKRKEPQKKVEGVKEPVVHKSLPEQPKRPEKMVNAPQPTDKYSKDLLMELRIKRNVSNMAPISNFTNRSPYRDIMRSENMVSREAPRQIPRDISREISREIPRDTPRPPMKFVDFSDGNGGKKPFVQRNHNRPMKRRF